MPIGGYLTGTRVARNTPSITRNKQCGGDKKQGLAISGGWMRSGYLISLPSITSCNSRLNKTICFRFCGDFPITMRPATSGGVGVQNILIRRNH